MAYNRFACDTIVINSREKCWPWQKLFHFYFEYKLIIYSYSGGAEGYSDIQTESNYIIFSRIYRRRCITKSKQKSSQVKGSTRKETWILAIVRDTRTISNLPWNQTREAILVNQSGFVFSSISFPCQQPGQKLLQQGGLQRRETR